MSTPILSAHSDAQTQLSSSAIVSESSFSVLNKAKEASGAVPTKVPFISAQIVLKTLIPWLPT